MAEMQPTQTVPLPGQAQPPAAPGTQSAPQDAPEQPKGIQVRVGGTMLELPAGADETAIGRAVEHFRTTPEFDALIDKDRGAPAMVRTVVGSASKQEDKLTNLRRYYPDAVPYGDDNFVFTDPETERPTLYNPPGLDAGDVAGVAREITVGGYSTLGAVYGGVTGGPLGAAVGAGAGAAVGGELFDLTANFFLDRVDTRSASRRVAESGMEFMAGASGERMGQLVSKGIQNAAGGAKTAAQKLAQSFRQLRIDPPAGAVSTSKTVAVLEKTLEGAPFSADIMEKQAKRVLAQTQDAAETLARRIGTPRTPEGAGEVIKQAAVKAAERFGFTQEKAYSKAFDLVGADRPVVMQSVTALREGMEAELARAPQSLKSSLGGAIRMLKELEADAGFEGLAFDALRQVRTMIGKNLDQPVLSGSTGAQNAAMKRVYGALTEDMSAAAREAGPGAAKALGVADRFTRAWMNTAAKTMEKVSRFDADKKAFDYLMSAARDGGTTLGRLRRNFLPEEWDTVASTVLNRMGLANPSAQNAAGDAFSVNTFLTNWGRLARDAPEALEALFGGTRYADLAPDLNRLVDVVGSLKEVQKLANSSNSGHIVNTWMTISALGGALGGMALGGDAESSAQGAAGAIATILSARAAAKLITNPGFVKWLITPVTEVGSISAHIGRLAALGVANPEIREEIDQYIQALRPAPVPKAP